jgi:hypothetical protein
MDISNTCRFLREGCDPAYLDLIEIGMRDRKAIKNDGYFP